MSVIVLNGFEVRGRFDSSFPTSVVDRLTAAIISDLDSVEVSTSPLSDGQNFSFILRFCVCNELSDECVLGVDYFVRVSREFRA